MIKSSDSGIRLTAQTKNVIFKAQVFLSLNWV